MNSNQVGQPGLPGVWKTFAILSGMPHAINLSLFRQIINIKSYSDQKPELFFHNQESELSTIKICICVMFFKYLPHWQCQTKVKGKRPEKDQCNVDLARHLA